MCPHHGICDMLNRWEDEWRKVESEQMDQAKHEERALNGKNNSQIRSGQFGAITP